MALLPHAAQAAPSFTVIATPGGAPAIGAIAGNTLYGTLPFGGVGGGVLFKLATSGTGGVTFLHNLVPAADGSEPNARLAATSGGLIWGTTDSGGAYGGGTLFYYNATLGFVMRHAFGHGSDGTVPLQGPATDGDGSVIGTTSGGALATNGALFRYRTDGKYTELHDFMSNHDGHCPFSGPTRTPTGMIYGTTVGHGYGGNPNGSVWKFVAGKVTTVYLFKDGKDGEWPDQSPVGDSHGNVYGTTHVKAGKAFPGAIWKLSPSGVFTVLHDFVAATDGAQPNSPLVLNTDGYLYGTTASGGIRNLGTVYRISPSGTFEVVHFFTNHTDGKLPTGSLVHDASGAIYGGTQTGTIFRISY